VGGVFERKNLRRKGTVWGSFGVLGGELPKKSKKSLGLDVPERN